MSDKTEIERICDVSLEIELKRISDKLETLERQYQDMFQRLARLEAQSAQYQRMDL